MAQKSAALKEKVAPKEKEAAIEGAAVEKTSRSKFKDEQVITLLVDYNPKRANTAAHASFECYEDGMTVKQFREAGGLAISLGWDTEHDFIKISDEFDEDAVKKTKPVKEPKVKAEKVDKVPADAPEAKSKIGGKKK